MGALLLLRLLPFPSFLLSPLTSRRCWAVLSGGVGVQIKGSKGPSTGHPSPMSSVLGRGGLWGPQEADLAGSLPRTKTSSHFTDGGLRD